MPIHEDATECRATCVGSLRERRHEETRHVDSVAFAHRPRSRRRPRRGRPGRTAVGAGGFVLLRLQRRRARRLAGSPRASRRAPPQAPPPVSSPSRPPPCRSAALGFPSSAAALLRAALPTGVEPLAPGLRDRLSLTGARKRLLSGKSVSGRVDSGGRRILKKKNKTQRQ